MTGARHGCPVLAALQSNLGPIARSGSPDPAHPVDLAGDLASEPPSVHAPRVIVAYSGGLDSTVLLDACVRTLGSQRVIAAHVHHGLQEEAEAWAEHCRAQSHVRGVRFECLRLGRAQPAGEGLEAWARTERYRALWALVLEERGAALLTAHHADDLAETLLMRLARGTGLDGLADALPGEAQLSDGRLLLRPLIQLTREQLLHYARERMLEWIDDPMNRDPRFGRVAFREAVMPGLRAAAPDAVRQFARAQNLLARAQAELDGLAAGDLECARLPTAAQAPPALDRRVIGRLGPFRQAQLFRHWWRQLAGGQAARMPSEAQCEEWRAQMIEGGSSQAIVHFADWVFVRFRDRIEAWAVRGSGPVAQSLAQPDRALPPVLDLEWRGETEQDLPGWGASLVWGGGAVEAAGRARWPRGAVIIRVASGSGEMRMRLRAGGPSRSLRKLWQERGVPPVVRPWLPVLEVNGRPVFVAGLGPVQGPEPPQPAGMGQADAADEPPRADALVRAIAFVPRSAGDPRGRFCGLDRL